MRRSISFWRRRITGCGKRRGIFAVSDMMSVGRKRVRWLMATMGLRTIYQKLRMTILHPAHRKYPYFLRDLVVDRSKQVWCSDITCIPMRKGFLYLMAIKDWSTRKVLS